MVRIGGWGNGMRNGDESSDFLLWSHIQRNEGDISNTRGTVFKRVTDLLSIPPRVSIELGYLRDIDQQGTLHKGWQAVFENMTIDQGAPFENGLTPIVLRNTEWGVISPVSFEGEEGERRRNQAEEIIKGLWFDFVEGWYSQAITGQVDRRYGILAKEKIPQDTEKLWLESQDVFANPDNLIYITSTGREQEETRFFYLEGKIVEIDDKTKIIFIHDIPKLWSFPHTQRDLYVHEGKILLAESRLEKKHQSGEAQLASQKDHISVLCIDGTYFDFTTPSTTWFLWGFNDTGRSGIDTRSGRWHNPNMKLGQIPTRA